MTQQKYILFLLKSMSAVAVVLGIGTPLVYADGSTIHEQVVGSDFLIWEAEGVDASDIIDNGAGPQGLPFVVDKSGSFTTVPTGVPAGSSFTGTNVLSKGTNPSGGKALFLPDGGAFSGPFAYDWTYHLKFAEPGTYTFYYRFSAFERITTSIPPELNYFNEDSFFVPDDFNQLPNNSGNTDIYVRGPGSVPYAADDGFFWGEGRFHWERGSLEDIQPPGNVVTFTVTPGQVGQVLDLTFSNREIGTTAFDAFVLTKDTAITDPIDGLGARGESLQNALNALFDAFSLQGDMDWDFDVDADDIAPFLAGLNDLASYEAEYEIPPGFKGDFTGSLPNPVLDSADIPGFVAALFGGAPVVASSVAVPEPSSCLLLLLASFVSINSHFLLSSHQARLIKNIGA